MSTETAVSKPFNIATHNGYITVVSDKSGEHRTIRVRTEEWLTRDRDGNVKHDDEGNPIKQTVRTIGLLIGSNNESDYKNFALIGNRGQVVLYSPYRDSRFHQWMQHYLDHPERFPHIQFNFEGRCRRCNRLLTDENSVARGIGSTCAGLE